jgi:hypothetical protein
MCEAADECKPATSNPPHDSLQMLSGRRSEIERSESTLKKQHSESYEGN